MIFALPIKPDAVRRHLQILRMIQTPHHIREERGIMRPGRHPLIHGDPDRQPPLHPGLPLRVNGRFLQQAAHSEEGADVAEVIDMVPHMVQPDGRVIGNKHAAPAPAPAPAAQSGISKEEEDSFREVLEMAKKVRDDTIRQAKEDAEAIRARAEAEATDRLDGLNEEKDALTRQVASLKTAAAEYRTKFEQLLQAQQEALEKASDLF